MTAQRNALPAIGALLIIAAGGKATRAVREVWQGPGTSLDKLRGISDALAHEFTQRWSLSLHWPDVVGGVAALLVVLLAIAYRRAGRQTQRIGEEHGSAAWGSRRDMAPFRPRKDEEGLQFTVTETLSLNAQRTRRNLNVTAIGGSGAAKTRAFVLPNVLANTGASMAITDPKGEIYREAGEKLEAQGYDVRCLNLVDPRRSGGFNPLEYIDPEQPAVSIAQLAEGIVNNTTGKKPHGADAFWERAEQALLTSLVAYVYFMHDDAEEPPSLVHVVDLAKQLEAAERNDDFTSEVDDKMKLVRQLLEDWQPVPGLSAAESERTRDGLRFTVDQYRIFQQGAGETKKGVIISLGVRLSVLDIPEIRRLMSDDTLALDQLGATKGAVFCLLPDTHGAFHFIAAMFWQAVFTTNVYLADHSPGGALPVPIQCWLDEYANIGQIPNFVRLISTIRSRGMNAVVIVQNLAQLKSLHKDDWQTVLGNCDSLLFLGGNETETAEYLSKRLGSETIKVEETSQSKGSQGSWSRSLRNVKRELMTPDEIGRLPDDECLYFLRGCRPFRSRKLPIYTGDRVASK
ncbi:VirD4-like conjugal transfer protein, CD1115 family [Kineococcus sp. SYSU DK003]|uniref:VirD4-like conjugal transfer protein, CD1115 family n=1 Tax=Kineococcus sp. SYSU DK003 TaxID=3383124 RepID=UPI003D7EFE34